MSKIIFPGRPLTKEELILQLNRLSQPIRHDREFLKKIITLCKIFSVSDIKEIQLK